MFLPAQYAWFEPVLVASIVVFIIDLVGNTITFSSRFVSALVSAIVFAVVFGLLRLRGHLDVRHAAGSRSRQARPGDRI